MSSVGLRPADLHLPRGHLLVVGTGALSVSLLPGWVETVRAWYPGVEVRVVVTPNALRFVTPTTLRAATGGRLLGPDWPADDALPVPHRDLADWADGLLVLPASGNTVAKLAMGLADTFALTVVQNARCPVVVVPAVSPVVATSPIHLANVERLRDGGRVVLDSVEGRSASSRTVEPGSPAPIHTVLLALARSVRARSVASGDALAAGAAPG
ncbi:flavoprotein [Phycicoccus flavus]|uniref:flavoprotein n=1 Tax=Phycicoccus flavus TaxID=2502783 RepID=UPI000FEB8F57|nr:flavoprotein [Phycicoccus flavus]NHA66991.1 hypothetical protein [Phycicoccus flavus]